MNVYLWQHTVSDMLWPCEDWFHVPLKTEWKAILDAWISLWAWTSSWWSNFWRYLKLPMAWYRNGNSVDNIGSYGQYWGADIFGGSVDTITNLYFNSSSITNGYSTPKFWNPIRPIKDYPVTPTSWWTTIVWTLGSSGIFWNQTDWLISISSNGSTWYTISDKNVWATTVWNYWDALTEANCGSTFQRWNNYAFPSTKSTASVTTSSTQVDVTWYWPWNYYSSSTWITASTWQSSSNKNLRWWQTKWTWLKDTMLKNAYIGEYIPRQPWANTVAYYPLTSITTVNDKSGNNRNLTNYNGVAFGTYAGVDCAAFAWNKMILYNSDFPAIWYGDCTISCWMYTTSNNQQIVLSYWNADTTGLVIIIRNWYIDPNLAPVTLNAWHHIAYVVESWYLKMYVDGVLVYNNPYNVNIGKSLWIWRKTYMDDMNYLWYINEVIIESIARTAQEIQDYYNNTKSSYWL